MSNQKEDIEFQENGLFWWNETKIQEGHYAPEDNVPGSITVFKNGSARLDLTGFLTEDHPIKAIFQANQITKERQIQGIIKGSGGYVLLSDLRRHGGRFSSNGISHEGFKASKVFTSTKKLPHTTSSQKFKSFEIQLTDLNEWIHLHSIEIKTTKNTIHAKYKLPPKLEHKEKDWKLTLRHDLLAPWRWQKYSSHITLEEQHFLTIEFKTPQPIEKVLEEYRKLESFLILMTNNNIRLAWPKLKLKDQEVSCFFERAGKEPNKINPQKFPTTFSGTKYNLGKLYGSWKEKHDTIGPGLYLFLGVLRAPDAYIENKFTTLIWGLESLHRKSQAQRTTNQGLKEKINKILNSAEPKDRRWLRTILEKQGEPSLSERLFDIFSELPIKFKTDNLRAFCKSSADRRNDISHFGGARHTADYNTFLMELIHKKEALLILYHAAIFKEIGLKHSDIVSWLTEGQASHAIRETFSNAGLLMEKAPPAEGPVSIQ